MRNQLIGHDNAIFNFFIKKIYKESFNLDLNFEHIILFSPFLFILKIDPTMSHFVSSHVNLRPYNQNVIIFQKFIINPYIS
jgi:hypothetical protein